MPFVLACNMHKERFCKASVPRPPGLFPYLCGILDASPLIYGMDPPDPALFYSSILAPGRICAESLGAMRLSDLHPCGLQDGATEPCISGTCFEAMV